jgi:putative membrane protein
MILPGVSGSFLLVLLGMYGPVLDTVNDRDLITLGVFLLGTITGLALFSQLLNWALEHHHDTVMAGLIGLMAGSLRILWPWPDGLDSTAIGAPGDDVVLTVALAIVALVAVLVLGRIGRVARAAHPPVSAPD